MPLLNFFYIESDAILKKQSCLRCPVATIPSNQAKSIMLYKSVLLYKDHIIIRCSDMMLQLLAILHHVIHFKVVAHPGTACMGKIISRGNKSEESGVQKEEEVIPHARESNLKDFWLDSAVGARSLHRLMGRLGKPLAERSHGDYLIEESQQAQQIP